jgi:hypothetical protein
MRTITIPLKFVRSEYLPSGKPTLEFVADRTRVSGVLPLNIGVVSRFQKSEERAHIMQERGARRQCRTGDRADTIRGIV